MVTLKRNSNQNKCDFQTKEMGWYLDSFFFIKLNTKKNLEKFSNLDYMTLSTFVHEYTHFLQDITTSYGLYKIRLTVDIIKTLVHSIINSPDKQFTIPVKFPKDDSIFIDMDLESLYSGENELSFDFDKVSNINVIENKMIENFEDEKYVEIELFNSKNNKKKSFHFGTYCIRESMAYLIESNLFDNVEVPQFPYRVVECVCNYFYPGFANDKKKVVALCDIALNTPNPPNTLIDILNRMNENNYEPTDIESIFFFMNNYKLIDRNSNQILTLSQSFEKHHNIAKTSICDYFTIEEMYAPTHKWLIEKLENSKKLRNEFALYLFTNLLEGNRNERNTKFNSIIDRIGLPILSNQNEYISIEKSAPNQIILLRAIPEIYNILKNGQKFCSLINYCKKYPNGDITDHLCSTAPWAKAKYKTLCAFAQIWKLWGLANKQLVVR